MKEYDKNDWNDSRDVVVEMIDKAGGAEKAIALLLMSLGNLSKHLAENVTNDKFNEMLQNEITNLGCAYGLKFMKTGDVLLKKYGLR